MFELMFAWALFTAVLGKSAEAAIHAWKGTAPPSHLRKMARIRATEAKRLGGGESPAGPARTWARTVWGDSWDAATERHSKRWPDKAAKKAEYARRRWAWWDHVEEESGRRWDERTENRRTARDADPAKEEAGAGDSRERPRTETEDDSEPGPRPRYLAWETPERFGRRMEWEELTDLERELWRLENEDDPMRRIDDAGQRGRLLGMRDRVRDQARGPTPRTSPPTAPEGGSPTPPDTPDSTTETPGQRPNEGVQVPRTPGQGPMFGSTPSPGAHAPGATTNGKAAPVAEVINLEGATRLSAALVRQSSASLEQLEQIVAWLTNDDREAFLDNRVNELAERFCDIGATTEAFHAQAEITLASCHDQAKVRDALEAAGGTALSKEALMGRSDN